MQSSLVNMSNESALNDYTIERITPERLGHVEQLYEAVYERSAPRNYFKIKYNTAYTGHENLGFVAYNKEEVPVAYYGVIPCFLQNGSEQIIAAQSADTMTHPKFRYKGMFVELSNLTFDLCRQSGIRVIFGFPNQNSYHGAVNKLGWKMTHNLDCFMIPIDSVPLFALAAKTGISKTIYEKYKQSVIRKYQTEENIVPNSTIKEGFIGVKRDRDYEKSKNYHQRQVLNLSNAHLWCKLANEWIIGDMQIEAAQFEIVFEHIKRIARKLGIKQIQFHASPGTELHSLFASKFKSIPSFPALFQQFDESVDINKIKFTFADIDIF